MLGFLSFVGNILPLKSNHWLDLCVTKLMIKLHIARTFTNPTGKVPPQLFVLFHMHSYTHN